MAAARRFSYIQSMRRALLFALVAIVGLAAIPAPAAEPQARFRDGLTAFNAKDFGKAYATWLPLAERGDAKAQSSLGYMYYSGQGIPQDSRHAAEWFYRAANQGEPSAQFFLALMHFHADGVAESPELSLMWCELAMAGGQPNAHEWRVRIMESMTDAQRREAWRLVAEWYSVHEKAARK